MATSLWNQLQACCEVARPARFPRDTVALFPPRDDAARALELLFSAAAVSLKYEIFTYTDKVIDAIAHEKAALPNFEFQATFDASQEKQDSAMQKLLAGWAAERGKRVAVGRSEHGMIVHRKIVVVDHLYVGSGSTNFTVSGERFEDNEFVIRRSAPLAAWYEQTLDANHARIAALMSAA